MNNPYLPETVQWTLTGTFILLATASVAVFGYAGAHPDRVARELRLRTQSWWVIAITVTVSFVAGRTALLVLLGVVSFLAFKEYLSLIPTRRSDRRVLIWAYLSIPIQYYWVGIESYDMFLIFMPVHFFFVLPLWMTAIGDTQGFLRAVGTLHWGLMATVFCLSHMAYLVVLPADGNPVAGGVGLLLFLILLTQSNDVMQYCCGKILGRRKVIPRVSPNKTWEGLAGGFATAVVLAALLAPWLTPFAIWESVVAGVLIAVAGFAGDAVVSALKRDVGVKDSGRLLPGHGGILDRVDSLIFTAPLFFHFTKFLHF
jgi:phosphatidate cytidylyltransferase